MRGDAVVTSRTPGRPRRSAVPRPAVHTPTLADAGGVARAVTTDPAPDLRLSTRRPPMPSPTTGHSSSSSTRFASEVSPACGRQSSWPATCGIAGQGRVHPPRAVSLLGRADTAVLEGSLAAPTLTDPADGVGRRGQPWGPKSMPWIFVVDGNGTVRAEYQGVVGTEDVDVVVSMIESGGDRPVRNFGHAERAERPHPRSLTRQRPSWMDNDAGAAPARRRHGRSVPYPASVPDRRGDRRRRPRRRRIGRVHAAHAGGPWTFGPASGRPSLRDHRRPRQPLRLRPATAPRECERGCRRERECRGEREPSASASARSGGPSAARPDRADGLERPRHPGPQRRPALHRQPRAGAQGHLRRRRVRQARPTSSASRTTTRSSS